MADEERGARVDNASSKPQRRQSPDWRRELPKDDGRPKIGDPRKLLEQAGVIVPEDGSGVDPTVLAALMIAQALDRLGAKIVEASAIGSYKRGP